VWVHNGFLNVDKDKMSKSLGNFVKPRDIYTRNDPEALRYAFLTAHYPGPLSLEIEKLPGKEPSFPRVDEAERRVDYLYSTIDRLHTHGATCDSKLRQKDLAPYRSVIEPSYERVLSALDDDLNTPVALAHIGELAKTANELCDLLEKRKKDTQLVAEGGALAKLAAVNLRTGLDVLGLLHTPADGYRERTLQRRLDVRDLSTESIESKLALRASAREAKDFARADQIRAELSSLGVEIADSPRGTTWTVRV